MGALAARLQRGSNTRPSESNTLFLEGEQILDGLLGGCCHGLMQESGVADFGSNPGMERRQHRTDRSYLPGLGNSSCSTELFVE